MWRVWEHKLSHFCSKHSSLLLRLSMGIVYVWYGALKIAGMSPAEDLIFHATQWTGVHNFVVFLGIWEIAIGLCLWTKSWNRLGLLLLFLQFPGTFLPLFLNPEDCFTWIPFGLTLEGQYIVKNLVLIAVGFTLVGSLHRKNNP